MVCRRAAVQGGRMAAGAGRLAGRSGWRWTVPFRSADRPLVGPVVRGEGVGPRHGVCRCRQPRDLVLDPCCCIPVTGRTQGVDNDEADVTAAHGEWIEHAGDTQCLAAPNRSAPPMVQIRASRSVGSRQGTASLQQSRRIGRTVQSARTNDPPGRESGAQKRYEGRHDH